MTLRHDLLVRHLGRYIQKAGGVCYIEPRFYSGKRPDAHVYFPSSRNAIDVSVIHPAAATYAKRAFIPLHSAVLRERQKISKYKKTAEEEHASFVPFVLETFGGFGSHATRFISDVSSLASESIVLAQSDPDFRGSLVRTLAIALQVGNAHAALTGGLRARVHAGRGIGGS
jgi:hypothetical protein